MRSKAFDIIKFLVFQLTGQFFQVIVAGQPRLVLPAQQFTVVTSKAIQQQMAGNGTTTATATLDAVSGSYVLNSAMAGGAKILSISTAGQEAKANGGAAGPIILPTGTTIR